MEKKKVVFYYLRSCDKCIKILKSLPFDRLDAINIKDFPLTETQVDELKNISGSYESFFSFRAQKLRELPEKPKTEADFRRLLLEDYTYLKRPVAVLPDRLVMGNSPKDFEIVNEYLKSN